MSVSIFHKSKASASHVRFWCVYLGYFAVQMMQRIACIQKASDLYELCHCFLRVLLCPKVCKQILHTKGFILWWTVVMCMARPLLSRNVAANKSHLKGFRFAWTPFKCKFRLLLQTKFFVQIWHWKVLFSDIFLLELLRNVQWAWHCSNFVGKIY